jgi:hypothetical protein
MQTILTWLSAHESLRGWLEMLGEWAVAGVILVEIGKGLQAYRLSRFFEAIKYLEEDETREARTEIYERLERTKPTVDNWWDIDEKLARRAGLLAGRLNLLAAAIMDDKHVRKFVIREWGVPIIRNYWRLEKYIEYREVQAPGNFKRLIDLYKDAKKKHPKLVRALPPTPSEPSSSEDC